AALLHDLAQNRIDILGHPLRVAAHEEMGPFRVEPFPNLRGIFFHPMLDINLLHLIARPCAIEPCKKPFFLECLEFLSVCKVAPLTLRSEKEPVLSPCSSRLAFLQIRTERRHSRPGADHDDWNVRVLWQMKMFGDTGENRHRYAISTFRKKR